VTNALTSRTRQGQGKTEARHVNVEAEAALFKFFCIYIMVYTDLCIFAAY